MVPQTNNFHYRLCNSNKKLPLTPSAKNDAKKNTQAENCGEKGVADVQHEAHRVRLVVVLDAHRQHVQENQHENCDFKPGKAKMSGY